MQQRVISIIDMIPHTQNFPPSKILHTYENFLDPLETTRSLSPQRNLKETPKKPNSTSINSNEIDQSELFSDKVFEKAKFNRLKIIVLKSITKDIEAVIRNELLRNKYTLADKLNNEIYKEQTKILREELKSKGFIIKDLLQTIKEIKARSVSVPIHSYMHD